MHPTDKLLLGLCVLLPLIIIVNAALWGVFRNRHKPGLPAPVIKVHEVFKQPWKKEDDGLAELPQRIADLNRKHHAEDGPPD
jgi:hypothetical protein